MKTEAILKFILLPALAVLGFVLQSVAAAEIPTALTALFIAAFAVAALWKTETRGILSAFKIIPLAMCIVVGLSPASPQAMAQESAGQGSVVRCENITLGSNDMTMGDFVQNFLARCGDESIDVDCLSRDNNARVVIVSAHNVVEWMSNSFWPFDFVLGWISPRNDDSDNRDQRNDDSDIHEWAIVEIPNDSTWEGTLRGWASDTAGKFRHFLRTEHQFSINLKCSGEACYYRGPRQESQ